MPFPSRWRTWFKVAGPLLLLGLALPRLALLDLEAFDRASRWLRAWAPAPQTGVVLVGIDNDTEAAYREPVALWHHHLAAVLGGLAQARPRAVGLDVNLPSGAWDVLPPGANAALYRGLHELSKAAPFVVGVTLDAQRVRPLFPPFRHAIGEAQGMGLVAFPQDPDGLVRRFQEQFGEGSEPATLSGKLAHRLGLPVREGWLDYRVGGSVPYVPFHQVEAWTRAGRVDELRAAFAGKVVFVGSVLPFVDRHFQVVDLNGWGEANPTRFTPGVLLHVQAMRNHLAGGPLRPVPGWARGLACLVAAGLGAWVAQRRWAALGLLVVLALWAGLWLGLPLRGWTLAPAVPAAALLLAFAWGKGDAALDKLQERKRLRAVFGGYVSPGVLEELLSGRLDPTLAGESMELCVLFSDIRGFTTLSEGRRPEDIIALLNRYFDRMAPEVHAQGGAIDSYMGDGIMAHFGHPNRMPNPALAGFRAAQGMLRALEAFNAELAVEGLPPLRIGIGLHLGPAVVGHIGSRDRHEYTAIGDTVNTASRVEGLTKEAGYPVLLTAAAARGLPSTEGLVPLGPKAVKGRSAVEVFGWAPPGPLSSPEGVDP
jgi:class 3 adenylate cyclase/CHASE2 domain-containing sensor protein